VCVLGVGGGDRWYNRGEGWGRALGTATQVHEIFAVLVRFASRREAGKVFDQFEQVWWVCGCVCVVLTHAAGGGGGSGFACGSSVAASPAILLLLHAAARARM
jgi:hypothetical protein